VENSTYGVLCVGDLLVNMLKTIEEGRQTEKSQFESLGNEFSREMLTQTTNSDDKASRSLETGFH